MIQYHFPQRTHGLLVFWVINCLLLSNRLSSTLHSYKCVWFLIFPRRTGRTRAQRVFPQSRSRTTQTRALQGRRWRRRIAACTPATCATRSSRRAARCWGTNTNTQVNTRVSQGLHMNTARKKEPELVSPSLTLLGPGKDESECKQKGDFELQHKEGWTPPFQQVLLNMHRRGLRISFRQLPTSALPASHVKQEASSGSDLDCSMMMILWPSSGQHSQRHFRCFFSLLLWYLARDHSFRLQMISC